MLITCEISEIDIKKKLDQKVMFLGKINACLTLKVLICTAIIFRYGIRLFLERYLLLLFKSLISFTY